MMYLGPLVMESLLFPNLSSYFSRLEPSMSSSNPNQAQRLEAQNCFGILVVCTLQLEVICCPLIFLLK